MIMGTSGSGKSTLGLILMGLGCTLIADDRVHLSAEAGAIVATCPPTIEGLIEARGVGVLNAQHATAVKMVLAVDLDQLETERLPQRHLFTHLGCELPLIYRIDAPHFAPAILQILRAGWSDR